jgi:hypothetical protein
VWLDLACRLHHFDITFFAQYLESLAMYSWICFASFFARDVSRLPRLHLTLEIQFGDSVRIEVAGKLNGFARNDGVIELLLPAARTIRSIVARIIRAPTTAR